MKNIKKLIGLFILILSFSCTNEALDNNFGTLQGNQKFVFIV